MEPVTPNIFCNKCQGLYSLPHECGKDKPVEYEKEPRDPNARPVAVSKVDDMTEAEIDALRAALARRDQREVVRRDAKTALGVLFRTGQGCTVIQAIRNNYFTPQDVAKVVADIVEEK